MSEFLSHSSRTCSTGACCRSCSRCSAWCSWPQLAYAVLGGRLDELHPGRLEQRIVRRRRATGAIAVSQAPAPDQAVAETTSGSRSAARRSHTTRSRRCPGRRRPRPATSAGSRRPQELRRPPAASSSGSGKSASSSGGNDSRARPSNRSRRRSRSHSLYHARPVRRRAGGGRRGAAAARTAQPYKDMKPSMNRCPGKDNPHARLPRRSAEERQRRRLRARRAKRSCTAAPPACRAPTQCQAIDLKPGQTEKLEVRRTDRPARHLRTEARQHHQDVSSTASTARAHAASNAKSRAGRALLRDAGLSALPGLRYSPARRTGAIGHRLRSSPLLTQRDAVSKLATRAAVTGAASVVRRRAAPGHHNRAARERDRK